MCPLTLDDTTLTPEHFLPARARPKDTGYDVRSASSTPVELKPGAYVKIPLGIRMLAPPGWWLNLVPRSGTFVNRYLHPLYGVIDETYENELCFVAQYIPDANRILPANNNPVIRPGERIAQIIPVERVEAKFHLAEESWMEEQFKLRNDSRGLGGFGSSGVK